MGALCFKTANNDSDGDNNNQNNNKNGNHQMNRKVTIKEEEIVVAKMKMQKDRIYTREKGLNKKITVLEDKVKESIRNKDKESAKYHLSQVKLTQKYIQDCRNKQLFIDKQINVLEQTMDDKEFYDTVKASNQALKKLNEEINMEDIRIAQELQQEAKMNQNEMNQIMEQNDIDQDEIDLELQQMEAQLFQQNFQEAGDMNVDMQNNPLQEQQKQPVQQQRQMEAQYN